MIYLDISASQRGIEAKHLAAENPKNKQEREKDVVNPLQDMTTRYNLLHKRCLIVNPNANE
jgi:hypothetical protein